MPTGRSLIYAGARGRIDLARASRLSRHVLQPKVDGIYAHLSTGDDGRITAIATRGGQLLAGADLAHYQGIRWHPHSLIIAELELQTEAGIRARERRGWAVVHAFDALRVAGRDVSREPYSQRRDALLRAQVALELASEDRPTHELDDGRTRDRRSGRYARPIPRGWRRLSIVPQLSAHLADLAWADWVDGDWVEGLVLVAPDAPIGARSAKRKVKRTRTIDCVVAASRARTAVLWWPQRGIAFTVGSSAPPPKGVWVEVAYDGFYESGAPRFPRIRRIRRDL